MADSSNDDDEKKNVVCCERFGSSTSSSSSSSSSPDEMFPTTTTRFISASELASLIRGGRRNNRRSSTTTTLSTKKSNNSDEEEDEKNPPPTTSRRLIKILDCRREDSFRKGRCIAAENILPPPTLLFHRFRGKPDFWAGIRARLLLRIPAADHQQQRQNRSMIVIVIVEEEDIDDDDDHHHHYCGGASSSSSSRNDNSNNSRGGGEVGGFSSFLIDNLTKDGFRTLRLEKGAMTQFLRDYGDLCVSDVEDWSADGRSSTTAADEEELGKVVLSAGCCRPSSTTGFVLRDYDESSSKTRPPPPRSENDDSSSTRPFLLLPVLKLKDLTLSSTYYRPVEEEKQQHCSTNTTTTDEELSGSFGGNFEIGGDSAAETSSSSANNNNKDPVNIYETLYLGNADNASNLDTLRRYKIEYILNVTSDLPNQFEPAAASSGEKSDQPSGGDDAIFKYLRIPVVDNVSQNLASYFPLANDFIDEAVEHKRGILVHCLAGISRSVTFTVAYLMKVKSCGMDEAFDIVKRRKPNIEPNLNFMRQLLHYEQELSSSRSDGSGDVTPDSAVSSSSLSTSSSSIN